MKIVKQIFKWFGIFLLLLITIVGTFYMIYVRPFMQKMKETRVVQYDKTLTLVFGGGGNTGILVSDSLVLVIDTKMDEAAKALSDTVKKLAGNKPIIVINTHWHGDHSKGNKYYTGQTIIAGGNYNREQWVKEASGETLPTIWLKDMMDIKMDDDTVTLLNLGKNVHTPSDIVVYLHKRKMLFGGDVILNKQAPAVVGNADPEAYLEAFDTLPEQFAIETIIPGHGNMGGLEVIADFKQYFNDMKSAAIDDSKKETLIAKYKDWGQVPFIMSPDATISSFKKRMDK